MNSSMNKYMISIHLISSYPTYKMRKITCKIQNIVVRIRVTIFSCLRMGFQKEESLLIGSIQKNQLMELRKNYLLMMEIKETQFFWNLSNNNKNKRKEFKRFLSF